MPRIRARELTLGAIGAAALVAFVGLTAAAGTGNEAGGTGSSFSNRPDGARAAYLTLRQLGYRVERSHDPLATLRADPASSVLVLASPQQMLSAQDRRALQTFVQDGGVVLATGISGAHALGAAVGANISPPLFPERQTYAARDPLAEAQTVTMAPEMTQPALGAQYRPAYGGDGDAAVLVASVGEGRAEWWAASTPLTNEAIAERDNFELLLAALGSGERAILWDEHYHGHGRSFWSYVRGTPLPWVAAQIGLLALAAALTWSRRPGPLRARAVDARTSPMEFVETMGGLYRRAGVAPAAVSAAARRYRRMLAALSGLSPETPDERLASAAAGRLGAAPESIEGLLREAGQAASNPACSTATAIDLVARLQREAGRAAEHAPRRVAPR